MGLRLGMQDVVQVVNKMDRVQKVPDWDVPNLM